MNTYLRIAALTGLLLAAAHSALAQTTHGSLRSEGAERSYILYRPEGLPAGAPLVVFLHGYGGRNDPARYGLNEAADRHGFAVCYPEGAPYERGKRGWNVGYPTQGNMPDDVAFVERLVRHLQRRYGLSRRNVFCTGMSNGGDFCYVVASRRPKLFAALASVAGFMSVGDMRTDRSATPVPLLEIHGTADRTTRWDGDPDNEGGWGAYVAVPLAARPAHPQRPERNRPNATARTQPPLPELFPAGAVRHCGGRRSSGPPLSGSPRPAHRPGQFEKVSPPAPASMEIGRFRSTSPARMRFERSLTMLRWIVRFTGRAP